METFYILARQNGNAIQYVEVTKTGGTKITTDPKSATQFKSEEAAGKQKKHAPKKLKIYKIIPQNPEFILEVENQDTDQKQAEETGIVMEKRKSFSQNVRNKIYNDAEGHCAICGQFVPYDAFTVDHIIPLAKGGSNNAENLQCTCLFCNQLKGSLNDDEMIEKIVDILLMKAKNDKKFQKKLSKKLKKL